MVLAIFVMLAVHALLRPDDAADGSTRRDDAVMSSHTQDRAPRESAATAPVVREQTDGDSGTEPVESEPEPSEPTEPEPSEPPVAPEPAESEAPQAEPAEPSKSKSKPHAEPGEPTEPPQIPCAQVREDAEAASDARKWSTLARLTKRRECWPDDDVRMRLRVLALHRLGRYEQCAAMRGQSSDPEVQRTATICELAQAKEQSP